MNMHSPVLIEKPGIYEIPADLYHSDPCPEPSLSNSVAKALLTKTPRHAWCAHPRLNPAFAAEESEKFDLGKAGHSLMLHDPNTFEIIDAADWRTKEAKAKRDDARNSGKIPLLKEQWDRVEMMVRSGRRQLEAHKEASDAFTNGKPEMTMIWKEGDIWCRARLDWLPNSGDLFDDYKTTAASADPDQWQRLLFNLGYDMQAAFYCRGLKALGISKKPTFRYIVQEVDEPFALCVMALAPSAMDLADHKVARALEIWRSCLKANQWPGYPDQTCYVEAPAWHEAQVLARDERGEDAIRRVRPSRELLHQHYEAQAPI